MSDPYIGEIRMFAGSFAPVGWELCQGQLLPISDYDTLFNLIGNSYGGDGVNNFALPDLRGRIPLHAGSAPGLSPRTLAARGGAENVSLGATQLAAHTHAMTASQNPANADFTARDGVPASIAGTNVYGPVGTPGAMTANAIGAAGGSQPHDNMAPFLALNFIISVFGLYPTPT